MEVDGVLHSPTLPLNLSSTAKARMCPWGNRTANYLSSSHCRRRCTRYHRSACAPQAQMSPMGSGGRGNYSSQSPSSLAKQSPSLAKRANGLQLRQQQQQQQDPIAPCHKNIWPNPMQGLPGGCLGVVRMMSIAFVFRSRYDLSAVPASPELSTHPKEPACPAVGIAQDGHL